MSNILTSFLSDFAGGVFGDTGYLKDYKHASRLYWDNYQGMSPKAGWSYFVEIGLNPKLSSKSIFESLDDQWYSRSKGKIGLLAKTVDLPRITIGNDTINQYNRKTVVQTKITYNPVNITFHDDMDNMIVNLWKNYYQYYFADSRYDGNTAGTLASRTLSVPRAFTKDVQFQDRGYAYGLNNGQTEPFITFIKIFTLNRRKHSSVTLVNPKIIEYAPSQLDQSNGQKLMDAKFSFAYEAVYYDNKNTSITKNEPGFQQVHYDNSPSPLSIYGRGGKGLFGLGGLVGGATDILGTLSQDELSVGDILKVAIGTKNLVDNAKQLTKQGIKQELTSVATGIFSQAAQGQGALGEKASSILSTPVNIELFRPGIPLTNADGTPTQLSTDGKAVIVNGQSRALDKSGSLK
jgi:hypothetical protein